MDAKINPKFNPKRKISYRNNPWANTKFGGTRMMMEYESLKNLAKRDPAAQAELDEIHDAIDQYFARTNPPRKGLSLGRKAALLAGAGIAGFLFGYNSSK